jgi:pimeloyl-ACP methyl ester carboxylesterase
MPDDFYDSYIQFGISIGSECAELAGGQLDAGPHMSTATTARDMLSIVDAFAATEDGQRASKPSHLLNYYGISYGTFLGQTFASMFPERVGSMVLDAVVDPETYLTNLTRNNVNHLDGAIAGFFIFCHELGPSGCPYYTGSSAKDIYQRFARSYAQLDANKAREENWSNATVIESALLNLKVGILAAVYAPITQFGTLADALLGLEVALQRQSLGEWISSVIGLSGDPSPAGFTNAQFALGVLCSDQDNIWYNKTLEDFRPLVAELEEQSIIAEIWIKTQLGCSGWSIKAVERFAGPFIGDTATPILFVGNTYDPVTPVDK